MTKEMDATIPAAAPEPGARMYLMPALVLGFLGTHMLFVFIAISLAVGDRSFAVVPDYYQKAVEWDDHKAALAASAALGWEVEVLPSRDVTLRGVRELAVVLHDAEGRPITEAQVHATLYHHANASRVVEVELIPGAYPGRYSVLAEMRDEGVWNIRLQITHGTDAYLHQDKLYVRGTNKGVGR